VEHATHTLQELQWKQASLLSELAALQSTNDELRGKLEDSKQQLKGNEQMIRWLNSQARSHPLSWLIPKKISHAAKCQTPPDSMHVCCC
jgi:hypothetical protein